MSKKHIHFPFTHLIPLFPLPSRGKLRSRMELKRYHVDKVRSAKESPNQLGQTNLQRSFFVWIHRKKIIGSSSN